MPHQGANLEQPHQGTDLVVSQLGWGPWRWNADTLARLGGEGGDLLLKGAKVGKTPFASLAGWAKDWTGALISTSKVG